MKNIEKVSLENEIRSNIRLSDKRKNETVEYIKKHYLLYLMLLLPIIYYLLFHYYPMNGLTIAFKKYTISKGIMGSEWIGFEVFEKLFRQPQFLRAVRNTLVLNLLSLVIGFPAPILLALMLNELRNGIFKKGAQTILYLPHFLSWVIIGGMVTQIFASSDGAINLFLNKFGVESIPFLTQENSWIAIYVLVSIWQSIGWGAIIYMSAITGIDQEQYEAAKVDGCSRLRMTYLITLPNIKATIIIMLILKVGGMASIGFEQPLMLSNTMVTRVASVLSTYVYDIGINGGKYSVATAIGLIQSVINFIMVISANKISNKISQDGIW